MEFREFSTKMMKMENNRVNCQWGWCILGETGCGDLQAVGRKAMKVVSRMLAQLVERCPNKADVVGSSPIHSR